MLINPGHPINCVFLSDPEPALLKQPKELEMKTISQLILQLKAQSCIHENVLPLYPLFEDYRGLDWKGYLSSGANTAVLHQDERFRLSLIGWDGFQKSKKHGHPEGGGLMKLLSRALLETRFDPIFPEQIIGKHRYEPGDLAYIHDEIAYHIVENPFPQPAVSLHLYAPGNYASKVMPPDSRGLEWGAAA